jgi:hypothetical protein
MGTEENWLFWSGIGSWFLSYEILQMLMLHKGTFLP